MSALLILLVFAIFAVADVSAVDARAPGGSGMALLMSLAAGVPFAALGAVITGGATQLAPVYVAVIFGALLGRVTLDTGIARRDRRLRRRVRRRAASAAGAGFGAIVALLFTSLSGLGAIIMVGSIVLPIMMTAGVPRTVAATLFLMALLSATSSTSQTGRFTRPISASSQEQLIRYAVVLAVVDAVALILYAVVAFRRERGYAAWAVEAAQPESRERHRPSRSLPRFCRCCFTSGCTCRRHRPFWRPRSSACSSRVRIGRATFGCRGDSRRRRRCARGAAVYGNRHAAGRRAAAAVRRRATAAGRRRVAAQPGRLRAVFGVGSPLALYRGPLNPFGVGIAIFTVLLTANVLPPVVLVAAIMAVVQVQNVCDPTNTANVWVANFTGVAIDTISRRTLPYQTAVAIVATLAVVTSGSALFGQPAFASLLRVARADEALPGFYAPPPARDRIAVDDDGTPEGRVAADAVAAALSGGTWTTLRLHEDPNSSDCSGKRYAAYVFVEASSFALLEGDDVDVGVRLTDCGGWTVNEWHDHQIVSHEGSDEIRALAREGAARLQAWSLAEPVRSANLFTRGAAIQPGDKPTYFYSLFTTVDGNMRLYVRGGGPAYASGLRSGEIVEKIDGQAWWYYGTYPSEQFAYDGKPHTFDVLQGNRDVVVALGAPFVSQ